MIQPLGSRDVCRSEFIPIEPCDRTHHIDRCGNPEMMQVRFGQADIVEETLAEMCTQRVYLTVFSARLHGLRSHKHLIRAAALLKDITDDQGAQDQTPSHA